MKIIYHKEECIGCGVCQQVCPERFKMGGDGRAVLKEEDYIKCAEEAADMCPTLAIEISKDD